MHLVLPNMEELISRPFVGQIQFQLVLLKRIETESAIGCLVFIHQEQSGASSLAKHGGAYFSAVYGSIEDPVAAPGHCKPHVR